jgi:uncharacterized membrane protein YphA (DoxX/SURF4 family)
MRSIGQLQNSLRISYGIVPIVAGLDKFTNLLTHWSDYLNPNIQSMLPLSTLAFMKIVGVIEIIAGILVFVKPLAGAWLVMVWLICNAPR